MFRIKVVDLRTNKIKFYIGGKHAVYDELTASMKAESFNEGSNFLWAFIEPID